VKRKCWIKIHLAVCVETKKPVAFEITDERVSDHKMVKPLLNDIKMKDSLMDAGYDKEEIYMFLEEKGINKPRINPRKDAIVNPKTVRSDSILEHNKFGHDSWKRLHKYGMRWAAEGIFSAIKRIFGETVRATSTYGMFQEVKRRIAFYTIVLSL
jgi:transposase